MEREYIREKRVLLCTSRSLKYFDAHCNCESSCCCTVLWSKAVSQKTAGVVRVKRHEQSHVISNRKLIFTTILHFQKYCNVLVVVLNI